MEKPLAIEDVFEAAYKVRTLLNPAALQLSGVPAELLSDSFRNLPPGEYKLVPPRVNFARNFNQETSVDALISYLLGGSLFVVKPRVGMHISTPGLQRLLGMTDFSLRVRFDRVEEARSVRFAEPSSVFALFSTYDFPASVRLDFGNAEGYGRLQQVLFGMDEIEEIRTVYLRKDRYYQTEITGAYPAKPEDVPGDFENKTYRETYEGNDMRIERALTIAALYALTDRARRKKLPPFPAGSFRMDEI
jgi:hypothetical protein